MYTVYCHFNKINGKLYFGLTKLKPKARWGVNGYGYSKMPRFYRAIKKYGWDNFEHFVVRDGLTQQEACVLEKELIKKYHTMEKDRGYNLSEGGFAPTPTEETRMKRSLSLKGKKHSQERIEKIRKSKLGCIPWNKGIPMTKERYENCKSSFFKKGNIPWDAGKKLTEEQKEKLRNADRKTSKKVICQETGIIYRSVCEAARAIKRDSSTIAGVCRGKYGCKTAGGYHWKFV